MRSLPKVGILATHPVQYHAPVYRYLSAQVPDSLHVFFCSRTGFAGLTDRGFGVPVTWDVPLIAGYASTFLADEGADPGPGIHYFSEFWRAFDRHGCQVLLIWNSYNSLAFPRYLAEARRRGTPVLYRGDTFRNPDGTPVWRFAKQTYLRAVFRFVDHFLATGTWSAEFYRNLGIPSDRVTVAPYAIDNDYFVAASDACRERRSEVRARLGVDAETVVFNVTAKYHEPKRQLDLIRAAAACRNLPIHLLLVGEGDMRSTLEAEIARHGLTSAVTLTGFVNQSQIPELYVGSDVAVTCSTHNPWITVVNEAMCCALPVLLSDAIGAGADLLQDGENGYSYPMGNVDALADRLRRFVHDGAATRRSMGDRSRAIISRWGIPELADGLWRAVSTLSESAAA